jgi:hypothetical protein
MRSVDQLFAHLHNVNPIADRVSPACDIGQVNKSAGTICQLAPWTNWPMEHSYEYRSAEYLSLRSAPLRKPAPSRGA